MTNVPPDTLGEILIVVCEGRSAWCKRGKGLHGARLAVK